ncbi:hypothetical protein B0W47_00805 [Komagataeibacter nataicola]|uniref:Uncharacterized protein n=1 Tax=Komagataeibacter nataicola TaxID=265960 RepID=A0A9N7GZQ8_9PROT|nr:hypothetical protein [Komagataeibacter nataicola]AQU86237.1 hypothetical protein B0W47_00805 [Komagataeibacter nataicola]PYD64923.1 hypothetical protein CDI09_16440 [Komagataeibacter nataicola]WNM08356.1 hypothetical protein RI056_16085 [Komagataeibacter nataicola]GBR26868.1 hypothetical protein AA0616_3316 [Komagataeibacter nataicola NRIC 0616]
MSESINVTAKGHRIWRAPRARLLVNGAERPETGLEEFTLTRTRYSRADTLDMTFALDRTKIPANGLWFDLPAPANGAAIADIDITLQMRDEAQTGAQWTTMFSGIVDHVELSPAETSVHIQCRDYLAKLLDMRVLSGWMNMTGSEVVKAMISAAGLTPDVTMSDGMVGQFWQVEHKVKSASSHSRFQTAFDLASYLANMTGSDLYAEGSTIVCAPYPQATKSNTHILDYSDTGPLNPIKMGASGLHFTRDYQIAKGVVVHVTSWDSRQRSRVEYYWSAGKGSPTKAEGTGNLHSFTLPGARLSDLANYAQRKYNEIVAHERTITGQIPGRITLAPRQFMQITGTGTTWDGTLDVDAVTSRFSWSGGFSQQITLRTRDVTKDENTDA